MRSDIETMTLIDNVNFAGGTVTAAINHDYGIQQSIVASITVNTTATKTFTDANVVVGSDQITVSSHGYRTAQLVKLTTTGVLPGGLAADTNYYALLNDGNTIQLATTEANAKNSVVIDITSAAGGGTHTIIPATLTACYIWKQVSLDGTNYFNVASSTLTVSATVSNTWDDINYGYNYARLAITMTGGQLTCNILARSVGQV
jgi:hypothetical protein